MFVKPKLQFAFLLKFVSGTVLSNDAVVVYMSSACATPHHRGPQGKGLHPVFQGFSEDPLFLFFSFFHLGIIVQELCESRGGSPGLSVLTSLLVSVDVKLY